MLTVLYSRKIQFSADTKRLQKMYKITKKKNVIILKYIKNVLAFMYREFTV